MATAQIIDLKRDGTLAKLANRIHSEIDSALKSWQRIGMLLSEARAQFPGDREFGQWVAEQGFGMKRPTLFQYRGAAEFARCHDNGGLPNDWNAVYKISTLPEEDQQEVLERIEKGETMNRNRLKQLFPGEPKSPQQPPKPFDKQQELAIEAEVSRRVKERVSERLSEARKIKTSYQHKARLLHSPMTRSEYQLVVSCLHPDKPQRDVDRLQKAFAIMKKLAALCDES